MDNRTYRTLWLVIWNRSVAPSVQAAPGRLIGGAEPMPGSGAFGFMTRGDEQPWPSASPAPWIEQVIDLPWTGRETGPSTIGDAPIEAHARLERRAFNCRRLASDDGLVKRRRIRVMNWDVTAILGCHRREGCPSDFK